MIVEGIQVNLSECFEPKWNWSIELTVQEWLMQLFSYLGLV